MTFAYGIINFCVIYYRFHPLSRAVRIGVLGSTRGTDLQAIIDAIEEKSLLAEIPIVLSNKKSAYILERARKHGISEKFVSSKGKTREEYDQELSAILNYYNVDLVLMIGYMRIVSSEFVNCWRNRAFNVHPSLLPAFGGGMDLDVHQAVLDSSVEYTGCTVHLVDEGVDSGLIIVQKSCKVDRPRETKDSLKSKVQNLEGKALIEAIQKFSRNEIEIPLSYF